MKGWIEESGDRDLATLLCMDEAVSNKNSRFKTVRSEVLNCGCGVVAMFHIWKNFLINRLQLLLQYGQRDLKNLDFATVIVVVGCYLKPCQSREIEGNENKEITSITHPRVRHSQCGKMIIEVLPFCFV